MDLRIGAHDVSRLGDVLVLRVRGEFTFSDAQAYVQLRNALQAELSYVLLLINTSDATTMPPEARRYIVNSKVNGDPHLHAMAFLGVRPLMRGLLQLLFSAVTLIGRRPVYTGFFDEDAAAQRYLEEHRQRIHQRLRSTSIS